MKNAATILNNCRRCGRSNKWYLNLFCEYREHMESISFSHILLYIYWSWASDTGPTLHWSTDVLWSGKKTKGGLSFYCFRSKTTKQLLLIKACVHIVVSFFVSLFSVYVVLFYSPLLCTFCVLSLLCNTCILFYFSQYVFCFHIKHFVFFFYLFTTEHTNTSLNKFIG